MSTKRFFAAFLLVALVVAGVVSYYASAHPDGLTKVAEDKGFISQEKGPAATSGEWPPARVRHVSLGRATGRG